MTISPGIMELPLFLNQSITSSGSYCFKRLGLNYTPAINASKLDFPRRLFMI